MPNAPDTSRASLHKGLKQKTRENGTSKTRISRLNQSTQDLKSDNKRLRDERDALRKENQVKDTEMARLTRELNEKRALIDRMRIQPPVPQLPYGLPERPSWSAPERTQTKRKLESANDSHLAKKSKNEGGRVPERPRPSVPHAEYDPKVPLTSRSIQYRHDTITLSDADTQVYLQHTPKFSISPAPIATAVYRHLLCTPFGLPSVSSSLEQIPAAKNPSGSKPRNLWFINSAEQPGEPRLVGDRGLVFGFNPNEGDPTRGGPWSIFRRWNKKAWLYGGEYENSRVESLSKEQFCAQKDVVQEQWAKTYKRHLTLEAHAAFRGRALLRRSGVDDPSVLSNRERVARMVAERFPKELSLPFPPVCEQEILDAFRRGEERVSVIRMQCVGYDYAFIRHIDEVSFAAAKQAEMKKSTGREKGTTGNIVNGPATSNAGPLPSIQTMSAQVSSAHSSSMPTSNAGLPAGPVSAIPQPSYEAVGPWSKSFVPTIYGSSTFHHPRFYEPTPSADTMVSGRSAFQDFCTAYEFLSSGTPEARALCNSVPRQSPPTASSSGLTPLPRKPLPLGSADAPTPSRTGATTSPSTFRDCLPHRSLPTAQPRLKVSAPSIPSTPAHVLTPQPTPSAPPTLPTSLSSTVDLSHLPRPIIKPTSSTPFTKPTAQGEEVYMLSQTTTSSLRNLWTNPTPEEHVQVAASNWEYESDLDEGGVSDDGSESGVESELEYP